MLTGELCSLYDECFQGGFRVLEDKRGDTDKVPAAEGISAGATCLNDEFD